MAFKRENFKSLVSTKKEYFASSYGFTKKANFNFGSDVYVIPLGLESGYYETPCHRVLTHKVDGKTIGFNGAAFPTYIKCQGVSDDGTIQSSLCCTLAKMEKERFPEKNDSGKRIISGQTWRVHLPVLILGNSMTDDSKNSYPISKVALSKDLAAEGGLKFSYLEMSSGTFKNEIIAAYGNELRDNGLLDYDLDPNSEEFLEEVRKRLARTIIKVHGGTKTGFNSPIKEYSFFSFDNAAIASSSANGERDLIVNYASNDRIMIQVSEFLALFDAQVDSIIQSWNEKDLQEYYNSARGLDLNAPIQETSKEEQVEIIETPIVTQSAPVSVAQPVKVESSTISEELPEAQQVITQDVPFNPSEAASDEDIANILKDPSSTKDPVSDTALEEYEYDLDEDGNFFE